MTGEPKKTDAEKPQGDEARELNEAELKAVSGGHRHHGKDGSDGPTPGGWNRVINAPSTS